MPFHRTLQPVASRRAIMQLGIACLLLPAAHSAQAQLPMATAINRAARFRALSQRCAKAYTQAFLDVLPDGARDVLAASQRLIQVGFDDLAKGSYGTAVAQLLAHVQRESGALAQLLGAAPTRKGVLSVSQQADRMLVAAQKATEALEAQTRQPSAKLVNLAGRQRMLSQRLAKNYFLIAAGDDSKALRDQLGADRAEFVDALGVLGRAPLSTEAIRNELSLAQQQWVLFETALGRKADAYGLTTIATTSERVLEVMNNLTSMYEAALKDLLGTA